MVKAFAIKEKKSLKITSNKLVKSFAIKEKEIF
jgi:hypothetical protein